MDRIQSWFLFQTVVRTRQDFLVLDVMVNPSLFWSVMGIKAFSSRIWRGGVWKLRSGSFAQNHSVTMVQHDTWSRPITLFLQGIGPSTSGVCFKEHCSICNGSVQVKVYRYSTPFWRHLWKREVSRFYSPSPVRETPKGDRGKKKPFNRQMAISLPFFRLVLSLKKKSNETNFLPFLKFSNDNLFIKIRCHWIVWSMDELTGTFH